MRTASPWRRTSSSGSLRHAAKLGMWPSTRDVYRIHISPTTTMMLLRTCNQPQTLTSRLSNAAERPVADSAMPLSSVAFLMGFVHCLTVCVDRHTFDMGDFVECIATRIAVSLLLCLAFVL